MLPRTEYLRSPTTEMHRQFYGEIVAALAENHAPVHFDAKFLARCKAALAAGDEHMNTIPLGEWDARVQSLRGANAELQKRGDYLTLGNGVCILKEAARLAVTDA